MNSVTFEFLQDLVRERSAIVLADEKEYLAEVRLDPIRRAEGLDTIDALIEVVRRRPRGDLEGAVIDAITTNETSFFRDARPFRLLREQVFPDLIKARADTRKLAIWCGASSSGQEAYSLLMMLDRDFPQLRDWELHFVASDLSQEMLTRAREGIYTQHEVNRGLPADYLVRYFERDEEGGFRIKEALRRRVRFEQINLIGTWPPMPLLDLVLMRNVLIYFEPETRTRVLEGVHQRMRSDGYLFLGSSETTVTLHEGFEACSNELGTCYRPS